MPRCVHGAGSKVQRCQLCSGGRGAQVCAFWGASASVRHKATNLSRLVFTCMHIFRVKKGKCEFQYCELNSDLKFFGTRHFISYVYNGPALKPDGWRQVGTTKELHLGCTKLNQGWWTIYLWFAFTNLLYLSCTNLRAIFFFFHSNAPRLRTKHFHSRNYDPANGPKYDSKYPSLVQCKNACKNQVAGCDAINYSKYVLV